MNDELLFQQNPAGINQVLTVIPGCISLNFNPTPVCRHPSLSGSSETVLILAGHCYSLLGDFRAAYEQTLAIGGVKECVQFYLDLKPAHGGPCTSKRDPWEMLAVAQQNSMKSGASTSSWERPPVLYEMALAV